LYVLPQVVVVYDVPLMTSSKNNFDTPYVYQDDSVLDIHIPALDSIS
ncbi:unnamed protein product, partial [marine sediment metagenome]